jgi:glycosyltransferase involved in cell wall biosynthesis
MAVSVLSVITHVYNAQGGVDEQLDSWRTLPAAIREKIEFIVIDDYSDSPLSVDANGLNVRLFRVLDDIDWNMPGCRNLAALHASAPWMLFFDVDNVLPPPMAVRLIEGLPSLDSSTLYVFRRVHDGVEVAPHINSFLITKRGFYRAGGYDEDFAGHYGFEDVLFRNMWRRYVGKEVMLADIAFLQKGWRTNSLDRDLTRNQALIQFKATTGFAKPKGYVRFDWEEIGG